jgi:hypothetical protein
LDAGETAYYASGAYDRALFDKPLAHATLYQSFVAAKARGRRWFGMGTVPLAGQGFDAKEIAIGHFKHGFTSRTINSTNWTVPIATTAAPLEQV